MHYACARLDCRVRHQDSQHRLLTSYDFGLQHVELAGVLNINNTNVVVNILTFLKASRAQNGSLVRTIRMKRRGIVQFT